MWPHRQPNDDRKRVSALTEPLGEQKLRGLLPRKLRLLYEEKEVNVVKSTTLHPTDPTPTHNQNLRPRLTEQSSTIGHPSAPRLAFALGL